MTVGELAGRLSAETMAGDGAEREIRGCFVCDIMSRALEKGFSGMAWITHRADMNSLAVAVMKGAACMIFPEGIRPERDVTDQAAKENMPLLLSDRTAYELAGEIYLLGIRGEE